MAGGATSVSVVVPVKDGAEHLAQLLAAVLAQAGDAPGGLDVLVIDSGSRDGSVAIARHAGVRVLEIDPATFGHGRTRNLGAEQTSGDVIAFLTQDATPLPGWLAGLLAGFALAEDVGAVYGPHRARPDTSPMIARELDQYFATKEGLGGGPSVQRAGDDAFLSNVNAAYRRDCWAALRFPDVPYSEDQHFAQAMLAAGWAKAYNPDAAVLHAHDYPPMQFARRYFDEYRGLRASVGHVEPLNLDAARDVRALVAADRAWMREHGYAGTQLARWTARSLVHQGSRKVFGALGSRAQALPASVQKAISLEGTATASATAPDAVEDAAALGPPPIAGKVIDQAWRPMVFSAVLEYARRGGHPAPLLEPLSGQDADAPLHVACVIPPFSRGSGGHTTIFNLMSRLERMGHTVTYWVDDPTGLMDAYRGARVRRDIRDWFAPIEGPVFKGFSEWFGADVALATGWQTAHPVALLEDVRARAYLINDHEPEFYPTSVEERWAQETYIMGMHHICASPWLADIMRDRYGGTASLFDLSVDTDLYRPTGVERQPETVVLYGRASTARRAVPLAIMAIAELKRRRPGVRVLSFGDTREIDMPFEYEHLGVLAPAQLAQLYNEGTVGVVLSMTNYSLIPQEMLACGLPCVDLAGVSAESVFGEDGPVALAPFDPVAMADVIDHLMHDEGEWQRRSAAGLAFVRGRTWDVAAAQVEAGLREALGRRRAALAER